MAAQAETVPQSSALSAANVPAVVMLTAKNIGPVLSCKGKNIIIFLGREQIGKSTTINSLFGCKFEEVMSVLGKELVAVGDPRPVAPMGSHKTHGQRCTVFPAAYPASEELELYYLDTQGFFGTEPSKEEIVAASILLDAAVQEAKSVRLVYLEDSYYFMRGAAGMADMGRVLSAVIQNLDAKVYCLFNRFPWGNYFSLGEVESWSTQQKMAHAKERLRAGCESIMNNAKESIERLKQRASSLGKAVTEETTLEDLIPTIADLFVSAASFEEMKNNLNYAAIVNSNFAAGHFGCIDPLLPESVDAVRAEIFRLPPIHKNDISFGASTSQRVLFNHEFERTLATRINPLLKEVLFVLKYPPSLLTQMHAKEKAKETELAGDLAKLQDPQNLPELTAKYREVHLSETGDVERLLVQLETQRLEVVTNIRNILEGEPVFVYGETFCRSPSFPHFFWANKEVKYKEDIPLVRVVEILAKHTRREELKAPPMDHMTEREVGNEYTMLTVKDMDKPEPRFEATYTSAKELQKPIQTAGNIAGYGGAAVAGGVAAALCPVTAPILGVMAASAAVGGVVGGVYAIINAQFAYQCVGDVRFYARPRDKEHASLVSYQSNKETLEAQLREVRQNLEKLNQANTAALDQQISLLLSNTRRDLQRCPELLAFAEVKGRLWSAKLPPPLESISQLITNLHQVGELLYPEHSLYHSEALRAFEVIRSEIIGVTSGPAAATPSQDVRATLTLARILSEFELAKSDA